MNDDDDYDDNDDPIYPPIGVPFEAGSDTSAAAAESILDKLNHLESIVLDHLRFRGSMGATDDEVEVATGLRHQTASARRRTLVLKGLVIDSGRRRATRSGRQAVVWICGGNAIPDPSLNRPKQPSRQEIRAAIVGIKKALWLAKLRGFRPSENLQQLLTWLESR